ncbi:MAG: hypothetical protein IBX56_20210 [Methylomicrobium sp.]|nr:hypothetical protein [Methylomicrobium sp.]
MSSLLEARRALARQQKAEIQEKSGRRERALKPPIGKSKWRILPSWRGLEEPLFTHAFGQHFIKDKNGEMVAVHVCLDKTYGKSCPICESLARGIRNAESDETLNLLKEAQSSGTFLMNALRIDGDEPTVPVLLSLSPTTYEKVLDLIDQYAEEGVDLLDVNEGYDVVISRTGKGLNTKYDLNAAVKPSKIPKSVLENLHDLDLYVKQEREADEQKALGFIDKVVTGRAALPASVKSNDDDELEDILEGDYEETSDEDLNKSSKSKSVSDDELDDILGELDDL